MLTSSPEVLQEFKLLQGNLGLFIPLSEIILLYGTPYNLEFTYLVSPLFTTNNQKT